MGKKLSVHNKNLLLFGVFAVLMFALLYMVPYTRDDWGWGSERGLERLSEFFKDLNGRYAGNTVVIILTRFRLLRAMIGTAVISGIIYFMAPKTKNRTFFYLLAMCMVLLEPLFIFRQTVIYTAGFSNYVIPTLFVLIFIRYFEPMLSAEKIEELPFKPVHSVPVALLALVSCLFMEHITLYLLCLSGIIIIYSIIKYRKIIAVETGFLLGSAGGCLLMFTNSAYLKILSGNDDYRTIKKNEQTSALFSETTPPEKQISEAVAQGTSVSEAASPGTSIPEAAAPANDYLRDMIYGLFAQNWFFNVILCLTVFFVMRTIKKHSTERIIADIGTISGIIIVIMSVAVGIPALMDKFGGYEFTGSTLNSIWLILLYLMLLGTCFLSLIISIKGSSRKMLIFLAGSMAIMNLPLLVVSPVSSRCFFPTFILMFMFILECLKYITIQKWHVRTALAVLAVSFIALFIIYIPLYKADIERVASIREHVAQGKTEIIINDLPNQVFVLNITPESGTRWEKRFKQFYDIPEEVKLINEDPG